MTEVTAESATAQRRRWQLSNVILIPFYLMAVGFLLRYAVYVRTSGHWGFIDYIRALCVYDCNAYERLALNGYEGRPSGFDKGDANNWAFFPLYSILAWAISKLANLSVLVSGTILSNLLTVASAIIAWPLFENRMRAYFLFCFVLFLGPFSYYFTTLYTESLFLLFTVAGFVFLKQRDYLTAGLTGALMSATRSTGLLFAAAILIQAMQDHLRDGGSIGGFLRGFPRRTDLILAVAMVPLGLCVFALYMYLTTGDALAFVHIQRAWGRAFQNPFSNLWIALTLQFKNGWQLPIVTTDLAFGIAAIVGFILCIVLAIRRQWAMAVFCLFGILLPLSTNTYSMIRFVAGLGPLLIIGSILLAHWRWIYYLVLPILLILDVLFLQTWTSRSYYLM
ncbi:MAG TPA: hypothetical protein VG757_16095 [Devosia sp.]|nr:hypothetical protein [Devosia sp.]